MNGDRFLVDSVILIDHFNPDPARGSSRGRRKCRGYEDAADSRPEHGVSHLRIWNPAHDEVDAVLTPAAADSRAGSGFNGVDAATAFLGAAVDRIHLSAITRAEVLVGFDAATEPAAKRLLDRFPLLAIDRDAADLAARLRRQGRWKLPDALQAAVALLHGLKLATRNTKDFDPTRDEFVVVPYTLSSSG